jgi:2-keto-4-pentenoate hydratase/2-oxohepta-3-ene-1,7-dioic acid hydratase in catechol pathway
VDLVDAVGEAETDLTLPNVELSGGFIRGGERVWSEAEALVSGGNLASVEPGADWQCPFDSISSLRDFLAFEDHVSRGAARRRSEIPPYWYEAPVYYKGNHQALLGPGDECSWPSYSEHLDFELELALIIGRSGRDIATRDAHRHIFGFTIFNDFSARDVQGKEVSAWLGPAKSKDFANAFGPCIVTVDELGAEPDLAMICRVNGEEWGRARSSEMHWSWADMIAHVSRDEEVHVGDVYGSGTPGGCCGLDIGRRLEPSDVVELEVEGIGTLENTIGPR